MWENVAWGKLGWPTFLSASCDMSHHGSVLEGGVIVEETAGVSCESKHSTCVCRQALQTSKQSSICCYGNLILSNILVVSPFLTSICSPKPTIDISLPFQLNTAVWF